MVKQPGFCDEGKLVPILVKFLVAVQGKVKYTKDREYARRDEGMLRTKPYQDLLQETGMLSPTWNIWASALDAALLTAINKAASHLSLIHI